MLDKIEVKECELLVWGDIGGVFFEVEIIRFVEYIFFDEDLDDVFDELVDMVFIVLLKNRLGESVCY